MLQNAHDAYMESRIFSADPVELVKILYQAAITAVRDARRHLANKEIAARARAITKAGMILNELIVSLDHERGGEVSRGLARVYDYASRRLIEANVQQADEPLAEVLRLLLTVAEGWEGAKPAAQPEARPEVPAYNEWAQAPMPDAGQEYGSRISVSF